MRTGLSNIGVAPLLDDIGGSWKANFQDPNKQVAVVEQGFKTRILQQNETSMTLHLCSKMQVLSTFFKALKKYDEHRQASFLL